MKTIYHQDDDILEIQVADKPVAREVSHGWNVNISYAADPCFPCLAAASEPVGSTDAAGEPTRLYSRRGSEAAARHAAGLT